MEEGEMAFFAGKKSDPWMPYIPDKEEQEVGRYRLERVALVELPRRMDAEEAWEWCEDERPEGTEQFFGGGDEA